MAGKYLMRKMGKLGNSIKLLPSRLRRFYVTARIHRRDFTIISNNCWGGKVYQYFSMPYLSPTVGLYFFAEDYLKFVSDLRHYIGTELKIIPAESAKHADILKERNQMHVPIGVLDDIEIVFLHYKTEEEAREKWVRRCRRMNWDNVFIKFSRMDGCTEKHLKQFSELPFKNKFVFNIVRSPALNCEYYWSGPQDETSILRDTEPFPGNLPMIKLMNRSPEHYPETGLIQ